MSKKLNLVKLHSQNKKEVPVKLVGSSDPSLLNLALCHREAFKDRQVNSTSMFDNNKEDSEIIGYEQFWVNSGLSSISFFKDAMRIRMATMSLGTSVPFHIDSPEYMRVLFMYQGTHEFLWKDKTIKSITMKEGEIWFINPSFFHKIVNIGSVPRIAILADIPEKVYNENI